MPDFLEAWFASNHSGNPLRETRHVVLIDERGLESRTPQGESTSIAWADLRSVAIRTRQFDPNDDEVCWIVEGVSGRCVIPNGSEGLTDLFEALIERPRFDVVAFTRALTASQGTVVFWRKDD